MILVMLWLQPSDWRWHLVGIYALDVVASYSNFQMFRSACERPRVTCKLARGDHRCLQMLVPPHLAINLQSQVRLLISGVSLRADTIGAGRWRCLLMAHANLPAQVRLLISGVPFRDLFLSLVSIS